MENKKTDFKKDRRSFIKWSVGVLLTTATYGLAVGGEPFKSPGFSRPPIPNACMQPETDIEKLLAEVVETIVPGPSIDPDKEPGGKDCCAINLLLDGYYPFKEQAGALATLIDITSNNLFQKKFMEIKYEERLQVLLEAEKDMPILRLAYRAIRSAFFGGAYNGVGLEYVGYPGPNLGYRHLEQASFRKPVCKEMTKDGWMP